MIIRKDTTSRTLKASMLINRGYRVPPEGVAEGHLYDLLNERLSL